MHPRWTCCPCSVDLLKRRCVISPSGVGVANPSCPHDATSAADTHCRQFLRLSSRHVVSFHLWRWSCVGLQQDKLEQGWQLTTTGTGGPGNPTPASQAAPATSDSTITAQSDIPSGAAAVPAANRPTKTQGTPSVENNTDRPESATDGAEVTVPPPKPEQPTAGPSTAANTDASGKSDMSHGLASCEEQLVAFGTMCGPSNQQKLHVFLKTVFEYQEVSSCKSIYRHVMLVGATCPIQEHTLIT